MDRVVFKVKIPAAFEPEPFENGDLIPIPSIRLTRRCIQNYITASVFNRSNIIWHNLITKYISWISKSSSVNNTNRTSKDNRKRKRKVKVGFSPSKKVYFICFIESPLKMMKNAFYFILKALFVLKIFKFLSWLFVHVGKTPWLERQG